MGGGFLKQTQERFPHNLASSFQECSHHVCIVKSIWRIHGTKDVVCFLSASRNSLRGESVKQLPIIGFLCYSQKKKLLTRSDPLIIMYSWLLRNFLGNIEIYFYSILVMFCTLVICFVVMWLVWLPKFCSWCLVNLGCSWWLINRRSRSLQTYITYSIYIWIYVYI